MEKRITKKEMFGRIIEAIEMAGVENGAEYVDFLNHEIELISKKRTGLTKVQKENLELVERVYEVIAGAENAMTVTEIFKAVESEEIKSAQKVSALVKKLVDAGRVTRIADGKKAVFTVAE